MINLKKLEDRLIITIERLLIKNAEYFSSSQVIITGCRISWQVKFLVIGWLPVFWIHPEYPWKNSKIKPASCFHPTMAVWH